MQIMGRSLRNGFNTWGLGIVLWATFLSIGPGPQTLEAQALQLPPIVIDGPRPMGQAVLELATHLGVPITYEDPRWVHPSEQSDYTERTPGALESWEKGEGPRYHGPRSGRLSLHYSIAEKDARWDDAEAWIEQLLADHRRNGNPGSFGYRREGRWLHVVPIAEKSSEGKVGEARRPLDHRVVLDARERSFEELLSEILAVIEEDSGLRLDIGMVPWQLRQRRTTSGADDEPARALLRRIFEELGSEVTWVLYHDPRLDTFFLSIKNLARERQVEVEGIPWEPPSGS